MSGAPGVTEEQWRSLYQRLERPLFNLAYRYVWSAAEAEDVVHDAFLRVWARRGSLEFHTADRYLWVCVLNLSRKRLRWRRIRGFFDSGSDAADAVPGAVDTEDDASRRQLEQRLRAALASLPEKQRAVVLLTEYSELDYAEVAATLGIAPGTVASRRHAAVVRLRALLDGETRDG